jgi:hypothetical protein
MDGHVSLELFTDEGRPAPASRPLRLQAAVMRALLDELDLATSRRANDGLEEQLIDELERLAGEARRFAARLRLESNR